MNSQSIQNYGIKVGYVNSSKTYGGLELDNSIKRKNGFSVSGFIDLFNLNGFSISPEIKFIQKGAGMEVFITSSESPEPVGKKTLYDYHNYLSIPISLTYRKQLAIGIPFIKIAPRYDILLRSYDDLNFAESTYTNYNNVLGGTFSIGFIPNIELGIKPFIEISYHLDFTSTFSNPIFTIKNNAMEMNIGVQF